MFPSLRMNQLFGRMRNPNEIQPPDFDAGLGDADTDINNILQFRMNKEMQDKNEAANREAQQGFEKNRLATIAHAIALQDASKPKDVVLGPGALQQAHIGIGPDTNPYSNVDPKTAATLMQRDHALAENLDYKRDALESNDSFKHDSLDANMGFKRDELAQKGQLGEESNAIRANRADVYRYKAMNPGMVFKIAKGGNIWGFNPVTGESHDTGVDSGTLSDDDRLAILGSQHINEIDERGSNAMDLQGMRGTQALAQIAARVAGQKEVNADKPQRPTSYTQERVRQNLTAHQFVNQHPDLAKWITFNGDGTFGVSKNTPTDIASQINTVLYGEKTEARPFNKPATTQAPSTQNNSGPKPPTAPAGWKYIRNEANTGWTAVEDKGGK
jgi:hypothetical protein